jgi:hypothetical protein
MMMGATIGIFCSRSIDANTAAPAMELQASSFSGPPSKRVTYIARSGTNDA